MRRKTMMAPIRCILAQVGAGAKIGGAFLEVIGLAAEEHDRVMGDVSKGELNQVLSQVRVNEDPLTIGSKAATRLAFRIGRALAGIPEAPLAPEPPLTTEAPGGSSSSNPRKQLINPPSIGLAPKLFFVFGRGS